MRRRQSVRRNVRLQTSSGMSTCGEKTFVENDALRKGDTFTTYLQLETEWRSEREKEGKERTKKET